MLVSCSSCSAKFNIPDAKVAGKRARMKCKKCGTPIAIDGTKLTATDAPQATSKKSEPQAASSPEAPAKATAKKRSASAPKRPITASGISTRWRASEPSGKNHEMALGEIARLYSEGGFEPGTLVCAPGSEEWLPPYDHPEVMEKAAPPGEAPATREPQPTFTDDTVTLNAEESAKLTREAQAAPQAGKGSFFADDDVDNAMDAFDHIMSEAPPKRTSGSPVQLKNVPKEAPHPAPPSKPPVSPGPVSPKPPASQKLPTSPKPPPASSRPSTPPPTSQRPAPKSSRPSVPAPSAPAPSTRPSRPPAPKPPSPSQRPSAPPASNPFAQRASSPLVSPSSVPRAPSVPAQAPSSPPSPLSSPPAPSSPPPAPSAPPTSRPAPSTPPVSQPAPSAPPASQPAPSAPPPSQPAPHASPSQQSPSMRPSEPTFGNLSQPPPIRKKSSGLTPIFLVLILILGALGGIYLFRPAMFERGVNRIKSMLGQQASSEMAPKAKGPPFDAQAAGAVLGEVANLAPKCKEPGGPTGKGRAQVLYEPQGKASSVAVSQPFHETTVGRCVIELFMKTKVPAFGGDPVVVSKTFDVQ